MSVVTLLGLGWTLFLLGCLLMFFLSLPSLIVFLFTRRKPSRRPPSYQIPDTVIAEIEAVERYERRRTARTARERGEV